MSQKPVLPTGRVIGLEDTERDPPKIQAKVGFNATEPKPDGCRVCKGSGSLETVGGSPFGL